LTNFQKLSNIKINENPVGTELFHVAGQTDMVKLMDAFANTPRKCEVFSQQTMKVQRGRRGIALLFL
jgi:D-mannonate dehydratase